MNKETVDIEMWTKKFILRILNTADNLRRKLPCSLLRTSSLRRHKNPGKKEICVLFSTSPRQKEEHLPRNVCYVILHRLVLYKCISYREYLRRLVTVFGLNLKCLVYNECSGSPFCYNCCKLLLFTKGNVLGHKVQQRI